MCLSSIKFEPRQQTTTKKTNYLDLSTCKWHFQMTMHTQQQATRKPWWFEFFIPTISIWRPEGVSGGSNPRLLIGICCFGEVESFWSRVFAALGLLLRIPPGAGLLGALSRNTIHMIHMCKVRASHTGDATRVCSARARRRRAQCDVLVIPQLVTILPYIFSSHFCAGYSSFSSSSSSSCCSCCSCCPCCPCSSSSSCCCCCCSTAYFRIFGRPLKIAK